uniref:Uncharacterized protein n=1 Tax=Lepeophtheirus salmonis TaxID=72036 RepID=A0A0K2TGP3_LEPSM
MFNRVMHAFASYPALEIFRDFIPLNIVGVTEKFKTPFNFIW